MSTTEQKALELANRLQQDFNSEYINWDNVIESSAELRRLSAENEALRADLEAERAAFKTCAQERYNYHANLVDMRYQLTAVTNERDALRAQVEKLSLYESLAQEFGVSVFSDAAGVIAELRATVEKLTREVQETRLIKQVIESVNDPDETMFQSIEHEARRSFRRSKSGARGQVVSRSDSYESHLIWAALAWAKEHPTPSPLTRPAVPEGWKPSHQELYAMSKDAGQLTVMPPLEWLICFSARVLAAAPQPPGEVAGPAVTAELAGHFREALAWGKVYGARMELELWDEMRERMVLEFTRRAAAPQPEAQPEPVSIELDFKQATELLEMFGGEPGLVTLIPGDGHSGQGLYACWTDVPGEGAIYLGNSDDEARPEARPEAQPADPHANCPPPVDEIEAAEREHLGCAHCKTGIYAEAQPTEAAQKGGV